jgi:cyclopropane-fatty-acyl-phospholipid synthase
MWDIYLTGSEIAFRRQSHIVFQMQMAKRVDAVPLTRDYMFDWEHAHSGVAAPREAERAA